MNAGGPPRRGVVVLGSTGSIGCSTLEVIAGLPDRFRVAGLAAGANHTLLIEQAARFSPSVVSTRDDVSLPVPCPVIRGSDALTQLATLDEADIVVVATTGHTAIEPTLAALRAGKIVALANKETIVAAGELVMQAVARGPGQLRPIDSEHSAIWQCLGELGTRVRGLRRLILTASGGPFRGRTMDELADVRPEDALRHPTWSMGDKVTIDSATLMNKGLELIEARWLFDVPPSDIDVVVHPQSIVHSLVEFDDGALLAQLGAHDMRLPIQYALTWPERLPGPAKRLSLADVQRLEFSEPDHATFPSISLARDAVRLGSTYPTVLSAADEVAVDAFLNSRLAFLDISRVIQLTLDVHQPAGGPLTLEGINEADRWARQAAHQAIQRIA